MASTRVSNGGGQIPRQPADLWREALSELTRPIHPTPRERLHAVSLTAGHGEQNRFRRPRLGHLATDSDVPSFRSKPGLCGLLDKQ